VSVEAALRAARDSGRKLFVPYLTGGLGGQWTRYVEVVAAAGADAIEIGIPFSDPVMDGPTIQEASERALRAGATPVSILDELRTIEAAVPLVAMTYYNIVFRTGHRRFANLLAEAGVGGVILPDVPLEELADWKRAGDQAGIETVLLASPVTPDDRLAAICEQAQGFVYVVSLMGVTGERRHLAGSAVVLAKRVKTITDKPVLVGVGVSTPEQAAEAAAVADGVIVGSALMRRILDGAGTEAVADFIRSFRAALDLGSSP
jgi:tryptophan synthase alpha chain